jgi:hypothetical protein
LLSFNSFPPFFIAQKSRQAQGKTVGTKTFGMCKRKKRDVSKCVWQLCSVISFPPFFIAQRSRQAKAKEEQHVQRAFLCVTLAVAEADLHKLPPAFLQDTIAKAKATPQEKAAALLALAAAAPKDKNLADYYREKDERQTFPLKNSENRAHIQLQHFTAAFAEPDPFEHLKKNFVAQAKAGQLTPLENVVLQYLVFGKNPDFARFTLANLLLTVPPGSRLSVHNWGGGRRHAAGTPRGIRPTNRGSWLSPFSGFG